MARIPQYDQQQLRSSAVGTAGVDTSQAAMFEQVASGATQVGNNYIALQRNLNYVKKTQQREFDNMDIADKNFYHNTGFDTKLNEIKERNAGTPDNGLAEAQELASSYTSEFTQQMKDNKQNDRVISGVSTAGMNYARSRVAELQNTWAPTQRIAAAKGTFESLTKQAQVSVGQNIPLGAGQTTLVGGVTRTGTGMTDAQGNVDPSQMAPMSIEDLNSTIANYKASAEKFEFVYGTGHQEEVQKGVLGMKVSWLRNLSYQDPDAAEKILKDPEFLKDFTGKEADLERDDLNKEIRAAAALRLEQTKASQATASIDLETRYVDGLQAGITDRRYYQSITAEAEKAGLPASTVNKYKGREYSAPKAVETQQRTEQARIQATQDKAERKRKATEKNEVVGNVSYFTKELDDFTTKRVFPKTSEGKAEWFDDARDRLEQAYEAQIRHMDTQGKIDEGLAAKISTLSAAVGFYASGSTTRKGTYQDWEAKATSDWIIQQSHTPKGKQMMQYYREQLALSYLAFKKAGGGNDPNLTSNISKIQRIAEQKVRARYGR